VHGFKPPHFILGLEQDIHGFPGPVVPLDSGAGQGTASNVSGDLQAFIDSNLMNAQNNVVSSTLCPCILQDFIHTHSDPSGSWDRKVQQVEVPS
jgi:hypothetical protein